jgi:hypothetical protein
MRWKVALRRHAVTVVLVALALVAGVLVLVWDKGNITTDEADKRKNNLFDAWRSDDVTEVRITAQGRTGTLRRKTGAAGEHTWDVEIDGNRHPAEEQLVADYLGRLEFAESKQGRRRLAPEAVDRSAFKLDAPTVTVSVKMAALQYQLVVGGPAATGGVYVEVVGKGVSEVTQELASALDVAPDSFRSRKIVPYSSVDLTALKIEGDGGARSFERAPWSGGRGAGFRWAAGTPHAGRRVDARAFDKVLVALGQLQATRFLSQAPGEAGPRVTLILQPKTGPAAVIAIGGACPDDPDSVVVVRREPDAVVACTPAAGLATLSTPADAFVDRRVVGAESDEVTEVKMDAGDRKLELSRAGAGWHMRAPADRQVTPDEGRGFLDALLGVEAARFAEADEAAGVSPPRGTLRVVSPLGLGAADAGGDRVELVEIGAEGKQLTPVRRLEDGAVLMVESEAARALMPRDLALRGKQVWSATGRRVESLRIVAPKWTQRAERGGEGWTLIEPAGKGLRADPGLCNDLAEALITLAAERWVAERDDGAYGLDRPRLIIEAELEEPKGADAGKPRRLRLEIGAPTSGGAFARSADDPAIFVVPRILELAADRWLVDRQLLGVDMTKLRKATVTRAEGGRIAIAREGDAWKLIEPAGDPAATTKVAALVSALDDLGAETAVGVGAPEKHHGLDKPRLTFVLESGGDAPVRIHIGSGDSLRGVAIHYARKEGVDATFAIAQAKLRELEGAW